MFQVSVVMPSLNQAAYITAAVRSVLEQDFKDVELIVADGMSTDGTLELLSRLGVEYGKRLRWTSRKDSGPAEAINSAISRAQGTIIGWLNSDDLYAEGAVSRAVEYLAKHPSCQMVYGEARHIGPCGEDIGRYPTRPASTSLAEFSNGSFICQPTVFIRKEALTSVGPLDESIPTAFDFDLWMRCFKLFQGGLGKIRRIQAYSRLHSACLTQRARRQVALDGMRVLAKHLGSPPQHWFWTHVNEICSSYPFDQHAGSLTDQVQSFIQDAAESLSTDTVTLIREQLKRDARLKLSSSTLFATVQPDGWVGKRLVVKYRWTDKPAKFVVVRCSAPWPHPGKVNMKIYAQDGGIHFSSIRPPEDFILKLEVPAIDGAGCVSWLIEASGGFVPAEHEAGSTDHRRLAFRVDELGLPTA